MNAIQADMLVLREQLRRGALPRAYRALIAYMQALRMRFANRYGDSAVSALYQGYLDMTYFAVFPPALKERGLKIAVVFNYEAFRFEAWLAARNRKVQRQYWELFKEGAWDGYRVVAPAQGIDSIVECDLAADFDFGDLESLSAGIERTTAAFLADLEVFLAAHPD
ncbi:MAG: DUF7000 family protein [Chloroflexota bacterium]